MSFVCESLEERFHLAGWAPASISGWGFGASVHDGSAPFVDSGYFQMHMSGSTYYLVGGPGIANSSGAYTYTRIGDNSATLVIHDTRIGTSASQSLTFTSADTGTFQIIGAGGYQHGTFQVITRPPEPASLAGTVFTDTNGNFNQDGAEAAFAGATVYLDINNNQKFDAAEAWVKTDASGAYQFTGLQAGTYVVRVNTDPGQRATLGSQGHRLHLAAGQSAQRSFGLTSRAQVSGFIFRDDNANAVRDVDESGLAGVRIYLDANNNSHYDAGENYTLSNAAGNYFLSAPPTGTYRIRAVAPAGLSQTQPASGFHLVTGASGASLYGRNFGNADLTARISGTVFDDANGNFSRQPLDAGIAGATVFIDRNGNLLPDDGEPATLTDADGAYTLADLAPGTYRVHVITPAGRRGTLGNNGHLVRLGTGQAIAGRDFGITTRALVSGIVFHDHGGDGYRHGGDWGLANVRVYLDANSNGQYDSGENFTMSNAAGNYFLSAPASSAYTIRSVSPDGMTVTQPASGGHGVTGLAAASLFGHNFGHTTLGLFSDQPLLPL